MMRSSYLRAFKEVFQKNINLRTLLGFAISGVLLVFTFQKSGLEAKNLALQNEQWLYFAAAIGSFALAIVVQSFRARVLWTDDKNSQQKMDTYGGLVIGNFYNSILPGNLGEGARAYHFSQKNRVSFSRSLAAIATEKWIDAQVFVVLALLLFVAKPFMPHYISYAIAYTSLLVLALCAVYFVMRKNRRIEKWLWKRVIAVLKKPGRFLYRLYYHTLQHIANLHQRRLMPKYIGIGVGVLLLNILQFFLLLKAAGVNDPVASWYTAYLTAASMMIIAFIPSAPGNVGVLHYGIYSALILAAHQYGLEPDANMLKSYALFGVYVHLSYFIPEVAIGLFFLVKERKTVFQS